MRAHRRKRSILILLAAVSAFSSVSAQNSDAKQKEFDDTIAKVKKSDTSVDFGKLRTLYTELPSYSASGARDKGKMYSALSKGDNKEALRLATKALEADYLSVDAHMVAMVASDKLGDSAASGHHRYVVKGIIDAIEASGDGKTADTAFKVISVDEEYALLRIYGLQPRSQSLAHIEGHALDVLNAFDPQSKTERKIFFNIDTVWAAEKKLFGK